MNHLDQQKKSLIVPGKKYRFEARSAEEAVATIKDRMGPNARVLEVKQIGGEGLARFLRSPKLEIIASIPVPTAPAKEVVEEEVPARQAEIAEKVKVAMKPLVSDTPVFPDYTDEAIDNNSLGNSCLDCFGIIGGIHNKHPGINPQRIEMFTTSIPFGLIV